MRHPYALVPDSRPPSLFSVPSRSSTPEPPPPPLPQPNRRYPSLARSISVPALQSVHPLGGIRAPPRPPGKESTTAGHYVKHSSRVTLLLSGQREGVSLPVYSTGQTIEGVLAVARPSGVLALEVKIQGTLKVEEIGGSGSRTLRVLDEMVYSWVPSRNGPFPSNASFRYTLPKTFVDPESGSRYVLPPTYSAYLDGIPGFRVEIRYAVVVNLTRQREAATLWSGVINMNMPFQYTHRTRPALAGPFPSNPRKTEDKPRTLFTFQMRPWRAGMSGIDVHVYLPASQVCSAQEPIPFRVTLRADELALAPFAEYRPRAAASFLSLAPSAEASTSGSSESVAIAGGSKSLWKKYRPRAYTALTQTNARRCPMRIQVQRTTIVDTRRTHLYSKQWIGQGVVHGASRSTNAVVWSGAIIIPPNAAGFGGGFEVDGLKVMDSIVLTIEAPSGSRPQYISLSETIPLRLTSDSFGSQAALPVSPLV
ncbi:hypothetical protein C8Q77DRAFT_1059693 [Trametes polyzona]|nr:hypothetical protein C8Q77DRAFT_1059693 [Trametes polyzona]